MQLPIRSYCTYNTVINAFHKNILDKIKSLSTKYYADGFSYVGSTRPFYHIKTANLRALTKTFLKSHPTLSNNQFRTLLNSLYHGKSFTERIMPGYFLQYGTTFRKSLDLNDLESWLSELEGWCEVDTTCQSAFTAEDMLSNWKAWKPLLTRLSHSSNIAQRRASLVLLNKAVTQSDDKRLADVAFENIERLELEKDILITKTVSWVLRSLIANHRSRVVKYLKEHKDTLPKIAIRETNKKLATGKKS